MCCVFSISTIQNFIHYSVQIRLTQKYMSNSAQYDTSIDDTKLMYTEGAQLESLR